MSTAPPDFEHLLRVALDQAAAKAPQAYDDLLRLASEVADAVSNVTAGDATLELAPVVVGDDARGTYQLQLRRVGSNAPASDLGVFRVSEAGYPVDRWPSRRLWESKPDSPETTYFNVEDLTVFFKWMLSEPDSKLVVLLNYLRQTNARR